MFMSGDTLLRREVGRLTRVGDENERTACCSASGRGTWRESISRPSATGSPMCRICLFRRCRPHGAAVRA